MKYFYTFTEIKRNFKMKKIIILLFFSSLFFSCKKTELTRENAKLLIENNNQQLISGEPSEGLFDDKLLINYYDKNYLGGVLLSENGLKALHKLVADRMIKIKKTGYDPWTNIVEIIDKGLPFITKRFNDFGETSYWVKINDWKVTNIEITGIQQHENKAQVSFSAVKTPINTPFGDFFKSNGNTQQFSQEERISNNLQFTLYDDGWRIGN